MPANLHAQIGRFKVGFSEVGPMWFVPTSIENTEFTERELWAFENIDPQDAKYWEAFWSKEVPRMKKEMSVALTKARDFCPLCGEFIKE